MKASGQQFLYTLVFSIYCIVLFILVYWISERFFPGQLQVTDQLTREFVIRLAIVFSSIVFISFFGASYTVYGQLRVMDSARSTAKKRSRTNTRYKTRSPAQQHSHFDGPRMRPAVNQARRKESTERNSYKQRSNPQQKSQSRPASQNHTFKKSTNPLITRGPMPRP